jgi:hypothetical protein
MKKNYKNKFEEFLNDTDNKKLLVQEESMF